MDKHFAHNRIDSARDMAEKKVRLLGAERTRLKAELAVVTEELIDASNHLAVQYGHNTRQVAKLAGVSHVTIAKWLWRED
jgi:hypothetical protein